MLNYVTQKELDDFGKYEIRLMKPNDFPSYLDAYKESYESISSYMSVSSINSLNVTSSLQREFMSNLRSRESDVFGLFDGKRLLGVGQFFPLFYSGNGCQIILWVRKHEKNKKIGTFFLRRLTMYAFYPKNFRFAEVVIDEGNYASRAIAEKVGYELIEKTETETQGYMGTGVYCRYMIFDGEIEALAENYHRQPVDLIDHPAYDKYYRYLIHNKEINDYLAWPWEIANPRVYQGEPFGLILDEYMRQVEEEEKMYQETMKTDIFKNRKEKSKIQFMWSI